MQSLEEPSLVWELFLHLQDLETQKAKLAALNEDITHFKSSQPATSDSQGDAPEPSLSSQGVDKDLGQVIPPRAADQSSSSSQPPANMEEEFQAVIPCASPSSSNSHSALSLPTSYSDECPIVDGPP